MIPKIRKAPTQQAAMEAAFVKGTLPEEDRRAPDVDPVSTADVAVMDDAGAGSVFEKHEKGWKIKLVRDGVTLLLDGPSIAEAFASRAQ